MFAQRGGASLLNPAEATFAANLMASMMQATQASMQASVCVLTPYSQQLVELKRQLKSRLGERTEAIEISTVDAFQVHTKQKKYSTRQNGFIGFHFFGVLFIASSLH
jgi:cytochrome c-type biogenesis protein CcmH/NrfG